MPPDDRSLIRQFQAEFLAQRATADKAIAQLDDEQIRRSLDGDVNSVAIVMKHLAGNFLSRFTDFLTTDGEKAWRERDGEFVDDFAPGAAGRGQIEARWSEGWACLTGALDGLRDADLAGTVTIRGEPHTVQRALTRALAHAAHHTGQIVLLARMTVGPERWRTISIPRGGSKEYNRKMGYGG
ncbi:MAG: DUF1572 family protein [Phycisphaerales bacterium]|nr:DUF1572 family protein [Phycisphaerales bacterium]